MDLGSTRIKAARLGADGQLRAIAAEPSPALRGAGNIREADPEAYLQVAERVLTGAGAEPRWPLGVTSQRSSFLLWDRESGAPVTPVVSWQDRRAAEWCAAHAGLESRILKTTGLLLSPHYLGPKLATIMDSDPELRRRVEATDVLLGTLETWLVWRWSGGALHRTDPTMAARTLLFDLDSGDWSDELLDAFGVPREIVPAVEPTVGAPGPLPRGTLAATIADQAAGLVAAAGEAPDVALVSFGTGCFVLRPTGAEPMRRSGYLAGPVLGVAGRPTRFALEGTVNGGGAVADRFAPGPTELPPRDPAPEAFCLPDSAGVGAPHWRATGGFTLDPGASALPDDAKRRVVLEGLVFRVREILEGLFAGTEPAAILLGGGLVRDPFVPAALAACLGRPVSVLDQPEGGLLGAARLAAGRTEGAADGRRVDPGRGAWLAGKYARWRTWLREALSG